MQKHDYDDIGDKVLNFETMQKTTIEMSDATKVLKKLTVIINSENQFKHLSKNSQFFVSSFINKIDSFTFLIIKFIIKTENVDQLI